MRLNRPLWEYFSVALFICAFACLPLSAQCTRCGPFISVTPLKLNFPKQAIGTQSAPKKIHVKNNVGTVARVAVSTSGPFQSSGCPGNLGPFKSCTIEVTFTPTVAGPASGTTSISDGSPFGHYQVKLTGQGVAK